MCQPLPPNLINFFVHFFDISFTFLKHFIFHFFGALSIPAGQIYMDSFFIKGILKVLPILRNNKENENTYLNTLHENLCMILPIMQAAADGGGTFPPY